MEFLARLIFIFIIAAVVILDTLACLHTYPGVLGHALTAIVCYAGARLIFEEVLP